MALSNDNIIQSQSGSFEGASGTVSLPAGTTAGSLVLIVATSHSGAGSSGLELSASGGAGSFDELSHTAITGANHVHCNIYAQKNVAASESSWTLTTGSGSQQVNWKVYEFFGVGLATFGDGSVSYAQTDGNQSLDAGPTVASFTTASVPPVSNNTVTNCYDALAIAVFGATSTSTTIPAISGYTDSYWEEAQVTSANGSTGTSMAVAFRALQEVGEFTATASVSPSAYMTAAHVVLYADAGKWVPRYDLIAGMEFGTATGLTSGSTATVGGTPLASAPFDGSTGSPAIVSTFKRSGNWALKLTAAAGICNVTNTCPAAPGRGTLGGQGDFSSGANMPLVERRHFYFDTSLPAADVELFSVEAGSLANGVVIRFVQASGKIGVKIGTGTEVLSDAAVSVNTWVGIDWRYDPTTTTHKFDWQIDYDSLDTTTGPVPQTQVTKTAMTAAFVSLSRTGWTASRTATVYYDDFAWSFAARLYPIGDVRILPLGPDQTGTPTITGTTTNFQTYASNGTGTAWNANTARAAIADIPPVIGASSDGIMQVTAASGDYVTIPMETYTAAPLYSPRAARWYVAGWAASTSVATCNIRSYDGANAMMDLSNVGAGANGALDHNLDSSNLIWLCAMERDSQSMGTFHQMTQTRLDALALRFGYSTDATPDVGIHCVLAEVAIQPATIIGVLDAEDGAFKTYVRQDPVSYAVQSYQIATPSGSRGATLYWTVDGVDSSQYVGPNTTWEVSIGADDVTHVTSVGMTPDTTV